MTGLTHYWSLTSTVGLIPPHLESGLTNIQLESKGIDAQ